MTRPHRAWSLLAAGTLLASPVTGAAQTGPTLESLEKRDIRIEQTEAGPADAEAARDNYRRLLELSARPAVRLQIKRRLADLELELAAQAPDPEPGARRAVRLYREVLESSHETGRRAELLYNIARASELAGDSAGAIVALSRLIEEYPTSTLVPEARFRRAEMRFVLGDYERAAQDYEWLVGRRTDTPFYTRAQYKLGWAQYRMSQYRASLSNLTAVLQRRLPPERLDAAGRPQTDDLSDADREMITDTLRGITLDFAQLGEALPPGKFVDSHPGLAGYEHLFHDNLFAHYREKQRYTDASNTALAFAKRNPEHPESRKQEIAAIAALEEGGFDTPALALKKSFVERYGIERRDWHGRDPLTVPEVHKRLHDYLDEITRTYHAGAQESGEAQDYRRAARWYARYLTVFPDDPEAATLTYRRGSALFEAGDYSQAAKAFTAVAYDMPANPHAADAAYDTVLAWRQAAGGEAATDKRVRQATLRLADTYPEQAQATAALSRLAEDLYAADDLEAAAQVAQRLIEHRPQADRTQLVNAWRIRAAAAEAAGDHAAAETAYAWLLDNAPGDGSAGAWQEAQAAAIYRQGETLAEAGNDAEAVDQFLRLRDIAPAGDAAVGEIRATAAFDAAAAAVRADQSPRAITLYRDFREQYPEHELAPEASRRLAGLYLAEGRNAQAAQEYARLRDHARLGADERRDAALQAATLSAEAGHTDTAVDAYRAYLDEHDPDFDSAVEARQTLIGLHEDQGESRLADTWRERLIAADQEAGSARTERSRTLAARAALALAEDKGTRVAQARLTLPLERSLPERKTRLEEALNAYGRAADYGIADVTTAATYRIGELYYQFSQDLLEAPRPGGLSDTEAAQYQILLEEQAFPFEEQAIATHEANRARIADGIYDQWVRKSLSQLAALQPARYDRREQLEEDIAQLP